MFIYLLNDFFINAYISIRQYGDTKKSLMGINPKSTVYQVNIVPHFTCENNVITYNQTFSNTITLFTNCQVPFIISLHSLYINTYFQLSTLCWHSLSWSEQDYVPFHQQWDGHVDDISISQSPLQRHTGGEGGANV